MTIKLKYLYLALAFISSFNVFAQDKKLVTKYDKIFELMTNNKVLIEDTLKNYAEFNATDNSYTIKVPSVSTLYIYAELLKKNKQLEDLDSNSNTYSYIQFIKKMVSTIKIMSEKEFLGTVAKYKTGYEVIKKANDEGVFTNINKTIAKMIIDNYKDYKINYKMYEPNNMFKDDYYGETINLEPELTRYTKRAREFACGNKGIIPNVVEAGFYLTVNTRCGRIVLEPEASNCWSDCRQKFYDFLIGKNTTFGNVFLDVSDDFVFNHITKFKAGLYYLNQ